MGEEEGKTAQIGCGQVCWGAAREEGDGRGAWWARRLNGGLGPSQAVEAQSQNAEERQRQERQRSRDLKCSPEAKGLGKKGRWDSCRGGGQGQQGKRGGGWEHKGRRRRDVGRSPAALSGRLPLLS